jgi:hypothetical protein
MSPKEWLSRLGVCCVFRGTPDDARMKLAVMAPMLAEDFPPEAFTDASLHAMACRFKFFPSYAELRDNLSTWRRGEAMKRPALAPAKPDATAERARIEAERRAEWGDLDALRASIRKAEAAGPLRGVHLRMIRGAVARYAPQHLAELPAEEPA